MRTKDPKGDKSNVANGVPVEVLNITLNDGVEVFQTPLHDGGPGFEYIDTVFASDVKAMLCKHRVGSFAKKVYGAEMEPGEFFLFPWGDLLYIRPQL